MAVGGAVLVLVCVLAVVLFFYTRQAYDQVLQASAQVNELASTLQNSLNTLDTAQLDQMMQAMPEIVDQLSKIDVDALNEVLNELPGVLDAWGACSGADARRTAATRKTRPPRRCTRPGRAGLLFYGRSDDLDRFHADGGLGFVVPVGGDGGDLIDDLKAGDETGCPRCWGPWRGPC